MPLVKEMIYNLCFLNIWIKMWQNLEQPKMIFEGIFIQNLPNLVAWALPL